MVSKKIKKKLIKLNLFRAKFTTIFFSVVGLFVIGFISYFLFCQISAPKDVDEILPSNKLVFFVEFSKDDFPEIVKSNAVFQDILIESNLQKYLNQSISQFQNNTEKWLGNRVVLAVYKPVLSESDLTYYLFLETKDQSETVDYLRSLGTKNEKLTTEKYKDFKIISFSQSLDLYCTFMYGYFVCANSNSGIKTLIDANQSGMSMGVLSNDAAYNKVKNNLPSFAAGRSYVNLQNIDFSGFEFYFGPLKEYLKEGGFVFNQIEQGIRLNSYLAFEKGFLATGATVANTDLSRYIYADTLGFYLGGSNLTSFFQQTLNIWDKITPYFSIIIEGVLRAQIASYFGNSVTLENDFYPLFKNRYAVEISLEPETFLPQVKIVLNVDNKEEAKQIMQRLLEGFYEKAGQYIPIIEETKLPDGSVVRELVADQSRVQIISENFEETQIHAVVIDKVPFGFAFAMVDDIIIIASDILALKDNLSLINNPENSLAKNQNFIAVKRKLYLHGDEFSFFDLKKIINFLEVLGMEESNFSFISMFDFVAFSTKWFDDGMANEVVLIKQELN